MPVEGDLYVLSPGGDEDGSEEWVSPRPVDDVVVDVLTEATDLSADDVDDLDAYLDRDELATHLAGEADAAAFTFEVEGHEVTVNTDKTVELAD